MDIIFKDCENSDFKLLINSDSGTKKTLFKCIYDKENVEPYPTVELNQKQITELIGMLLHIQQKNRGGHR